MASLDAFLVNEPSYFSSDQVDRLLMHCCDLGASDITIQSGQQVVAEVNRQLHRVTARKFTGQEVSEIANFIYGPNAVALLAGGKDIDVSYRVRQVGAEAFRFRVNMTSCEFDGYQGIQITLRVISSKPPPLAKLGLSNQLKEQLRIPQGIVVISGATGSGKSTLLASLVADFAMDPNAHLKILTYESPIEYIYADMDLPTASVCQTEIPRYLPSFAAGVRNALRRKPGLILVGEARDQETIEAVIDAALTGHPVYTTVHSNGVADTMRRMVTIFSADERDGRMFDLIETVKVIVWQALAPSGHGGLTAVREHLTLTDEVRSQLLDVPVDELVSKVRQMVKQYGQPIEQDVQAKYDQGQIDKAWYTRFMAYREHINASI